MQGRGGLDLPFQIGVVLPRYARHSIGRFPLTGDAVAIGTNVRVQLLSHAQMLSRAFNRIGVRIQSGEIVCQRDDVILAADRGMRCHYLHGGIHPRSRSEHGQLSFQIALYLACEVRDGAVQRAPGIRLMANYARPIESAAVRWSRRRLRHAKHCQGQRDFEHKSPTLPTGVSHSVSLIVLRDPTFRGFTYLNARSM